MKRYKRSLSIALLGLSLLAAERSQAQVTNVVFLEDFSGPLNTNKLVADNVGFEGGKGTIAPTVANGVVEFTGTVTEQWWAGAALRAVPTFTANLETNVVMSVDRVSEAGSGTGHRSSMWILDGSLSHFILFGYNSEDNWEYNLSIGQSGDNPTGGGNAIAAFNDAAGPFLDDALHNMKAVANGQTVKLYLDDTFGIEVAFPFSNLAFKIGSYARANDDVADSIFDNMQVETVGASAFSTDALQIFSGQTVSNVTVRIPQGANKSQAVQVTVTSSDPTVAVPVGASGGALNLNFAAGASNEQVLPVKSLGPSGGAIFSLTNSVGISIANSLQVVVLANPGPLLTDDFSAAALDSSKWLVNTQGFEVGVGTFSVQQTGGQLVISGTTDQAQYWAGASAKSVKSFTATPDVPLQVDLDRVSIDPTMDGVTPDTGARTGILLSNSDRSKYLLFAQDVGETGWEVNASATGSGTSIAQFSKVTDNGLHHMRLVADGTSVEVFLDGVSGGKFSFPVSAGIYIDIGAYARALGDVVTGVFDNLNVQGITPPVSVEPSGVGIITSVGNNTNQVTVTIPRALNASKAVQVTATSQNPAIAIPENAVNGALTLQFAAGASNVQTFKVIPVAPGATSLTFTNDQAVPVNNTIPVTVTVPLGTVFSDNLDSAKLDTNTVWRFDSAPLDALVGADPMGILSPSSALISTNGGLEMLVIADDPGDANNHYPGITLHARTNFTVSATSPAIFEVDRTKIDWKLVTGTGAKQITGVWVFDSTGNNYVFFNDWITHDGTAAGWVYNAATGQTNDNPVVTGTAAAISAFAPSQFNDNGDHRIKVVANGTDVKLYLDGVYGASVPFPFTTGINFAFGTYVGAFTDEAYGYFDNAAITAPGGTTTTGGQLKAAFQSGKVVISWTGSGTLQSTSALAGSTTVWADVTPAPTGNSVTITPSSGANQFYRLR